VRRGIALGVAIALGFSALATGAFGVLLESALRAHGPTSRYASAVAVVSGKQSVSVVSGRAQQARPLTERDRIPLDVAGPLRDVAGVQDVIADVSLPVTSGPLTLTGRGWDSAGLAGAALTVGHAPATAGQVALNQATAARLGVTAGSDLTLQTTGMPQRYLVSGLTSGPASAYFTQQEALRLSGHPDSADALVVEARPGLTVSPSALQHLAPGLVVATGTAKGDVENLAVPGARIDTIGIAAALGGLAVLVALLVVTGLMDLSVRERTRELAMLRAVGATPRQVRWIIVREVLKIAMPAAILGGLASLVPGAVLHAVMLAQGALPVGSALYLSPLSVVGSALVTILASVGAAWLATRRVSRIRPVQALQESAVEPGKLPRWRVITGLVFLAFGVALLFLTFAGGQNAAQAVGGLVICLIWAVALLGPLIARAGITTLGLPLRWALPITGKLAAVNARAAAVRMAAVITPVALALSFAATQLFAQTTITNTTSMQALDGVRASQVLVSAGPGIPQSAYRTVRTVSGVTGVTAVKRTTVVMNVPSLGTHTLESLQAQGLAGDMTKSLDPQVISGSLAALSADGTVALSTAVANGAAVGSTRQLWLGDGTSVTLRVVAVYDRRFGFGDVLLPLSLVVAHATTTLDDYLLVTGRANLRAVTRQYIGLQATSRSAYGAVLIQQARHQELINLVAVGGIAGFILIGMVTTLAVATASRRRELTLLRLVGATRAQVLRSLRMETAIVLSTGILIGGGVAAVTLGAFGWSVTGLGMLSVPLVMCAAMLAAIAIPGVAAVMLPARSILRRQSPRIE
jgi:putative ABC transport system permease protein